MDAKQGSPGSDNKLLRVPLKHTKYTKCTNVKHIIIKAPQKHLRNQEKSTLWIERLERERGN